MNIFRNTKGFRITKVVGFIFTPKKPFGVNGITFLDSLTE